MTAKLNASTSSGLVLDPDNSGILQLQTGNTTAITIDGSQNVGIGTSSPASYGKFTSLTMVDKDGLNTVFGTGPTGTNGNALNFWNAHNVGINKQGAIYTIVTDGSSSGSSAMTFNTASAGTLTERLRLDSSGNLGLGVVPSVWSSAWKVLQTNNGFIGNASSNYMVVGGNHYSDSSSVYRYKADGYAQQYQMAADGTHFWRIAPSGTAGSAITFTQAMSLDASGNLAVLGNITSAGYSGVTQADIGTSENEIPLNQYLGKLAFMNPEAVVLNPPASATPVGLGDMVFQLTNNTTLVVKVKGSDGTVRSATLTLA